MDNHAIICLLSLSVMIVDLDFGKLLPFLLSLFVILSSLNTPTVYSPSTECDDDLPVSCWRLLINLANVMNYSRIYTLLLIIITDKLAYFFRDAIREVGILSAVLKLYTASALQRN